MDKFYDSINFEDIYVDVCYSKNIDLFKQLKSFNVFNDFQNYNKQVSPEFFNNYKNFIDFLFDFILSSNEHSNKTNLFIQDLLYYNVSSYLTTNQKKELLEKFIDIYSKFVDGYYNTKGNTYNENKFNNSLTYITSIFYANELSLEEVLDIFEKHNISCSINDFNIRDILFFKESKQYPKSYFFKHYFLENKVKTPCIAYSDLIITDSFIKEFLKFKESVPENTELFTKFNISYSNYFYNNLKLRRRINENLTKKFISSQVNSIHIQDFINKLTDEYELKNNEINNKYRLTSVEFDIIDSNEYLSFFFYKINDYRFLNEYKIRNWKNTFKNLELEIPASLFSKLLITEKTYMNSSKEISSVYKKLSSIYNFKKIMEYFNDNTKSEEDWKKFIIKNDISKTTKITMTKNKEVKVNLLSDLFIWMPLTYYISNYPKDVKILFLQRLSNILDYLNENEYKVKFNYIQFKQLFVDLDSTQFYEFLNKYKDNFYLERFDITYLNGIYYLPNYFVSDLFIENNFRIEYID